MQAHTRQPRSRALPQPLQSRAHAESFSSLAPFVRLPLQSFTPRRAAAADEMLRSSSSAAQQPFDAHLRSDSLTFGVGSSGIGTRSSSNAAMAFGTSSSGIGGRREEKAYAPRSLMDAQRGGGGSRGADAQGIQREGSTAQQAAAALNSFMSPAQAASTRSLRSSSNLGAGQGMFAGGPSAGIPSQSLRDSPFMKQPPSAAAVPAAAGSSSAAAAAASSASSHLLSTPAASPFTTDASPIRFAPKPSGGGALNNNPSAATGKGRDEEHKEASEAGLFASPAGAPSWLQTPAGAGAASSSFLDGGASLGGMHPTQTFTPGLGYAPRTNPCAVTVFGFAPAQAARVLARFHSFGEIVSREDGSEDEEWTGAASGAGAACNWMHLTYRTAVSASMALAQNGRVICEGALMIGVKPRAQPIDEAREGAVGIQPKSRSTPGTAGCQTRESIFERSAARRAGRGGAAEASSIYATPQATHPSLVRKNPCTSLMEYLFNY